jgi:serine/threonine-protein kinase
MGQVWLGRLKGARGFNKLVAVKTLLRDQDDVARLERMLAEEARIASLIEHPNVVRTIELGEDGGVLYLVMEWVDGEPLGFLQARAEQRGGMPIGVAVQLVAQVLDGLHAAHELKDANGPLGVVHRDVSPHNVLVTYDGVAKLVDFGIAKATQQASSNTVTGEIKGKFSYMAPEQILSGEVDRRCDIFATGIILYLLTTGRHPFKHHNTAAVIHAITTDEPVPPPSTLLEDYPAELERVLLKSLEKDLEQRWTSTEEMRLALQQAMPEAFSDAGLAELRTFMERAVGDRKVARREAIYRAQLAADSRAIEAVASKALDHGPGQSASSLRAISISQSPPREEHVTIEHTQLTEAAPPKRANRGAWVAATLGCTLALLALLARSAPPPDSATSASAPAGVSLGPPALPASAVFVLPPPSAGPPAASAPAPDSAQVTESAPASSTATASTPHPKPVGTTKKARLGAAPKGAASPAPTPPPPRDELIAPDYAR